MHLNKIGLQNEAQSWNSTKAETLSLVCMKSKGLSLEENALLYPQDGELESGEAISYLWKSFR